MTAIAIRPNFLAKAGYAFIGAFVLLALAFQPGRAVAATVATTNYVIFYTQGDCNQEDCISGVYSALSNIPGIVSVNATALASRVNVGYKPVTVSFANLKDAPFERAMKAIASQGYTIVSYVIHDTHIPNQDVIIPH